MFIAYYESLVPIVRDLTVMAASRTGTYYSKSAAFLISPLVDIPAGGYCLTFSYSMRSKLAVKITSHRQTTTLANWIVDGGRAFHRAVLDLPLGIYKLIWETRDGRRNIGGSGTPYTRYIASVGAIFIHPMKCLDIGRFIILMITVVMCVQYLHTSKIRFIQNPVAPDFIVT